MGYPASTSRSINYLGIGKQGSKGTGVAPTVFLGYIGSVDLDAGQDGEDVREAGTGPYVQRKMKVKHDPSGGSALAYRPKTVAQLVAWFLGVDTPGAAGGLFNHVATVDEAARIWLTIEQCTGASGDIIERFVDCVLTSLTISCDGNKDLMVKIGWMSLTPNWQATVTAQTYESGISGSTPGGPFRGHEATFTIDGNVSANVASWEVALAWKYDPDIHLSKVTRADTLKLELTGSVKCKQLLDGNTVRDDYRKIVYGSAAGTVADKNFYGAGVFLVVYDNGLTVANLRQATISAPNIDWTVAKYTGLNPDGETIYMEREGTIKKVAGTSFVTITTLTADAGAY